MRKTFFYSRRKFTVDVAETGFFRRGLGLMFRTSGTNNLLFNISSESASKLLTAWFVFFPFLVLWIDGSKVADFRFVRPFEAFIDTTRRFSSIIELPLNKKNRDIELFFRRRSLQ